MYATLIRLTAKRDLPAVSRRPETKSMT
ncbi:hypothetical protein FRAAL6688 [Frankia alni ACN14a]|uniref:Uncharacterized protein n=1 Tax=Frankia alni (strain DSM 45986 / CECT 9034 / ACN14a) TaxID=326424 RepID=Q0RB77_FRAAA|nr:hypothetical protein FRAAL6688 [Frankia alni ACN14a]